MSKTAQDSKLDSLHLSHKDYLSIDRNYNQAALAADLRYVSDKDPGIKRVKKGKGFFYTVEGKTITNPETLQRIKSLVIPPAWKNVWICSKPNGHIQATGQDLRGRKQYKYHKAWEALRNETKFHRLYEFGKKIPALRLTVEEDLSKSSLCEQRVIATIISLMERTYIRIGSEDYEKLYGSYGLTTLKDSHVNIKGNTATFSFRGKKGIYHEISLKHPRLAKMVKQCREIPGKELFQYYDEEGARHPIDSGMVNHYIKSATGGDFTAKDFRTWAGTIQMLRALSALGAAVTKTDCKKKVTAAIDEVSKKLGNTRTVCKKYYVHPGVVKLYEENHLTRYLKELDKIEKNDDLTGYTSEEKILMKILQPMM